MEDSTLSQRNQKTPWKLIILCIVFVIIFLFFTFYPPVKVLLWEMKELFQKWGIGGQALLVIIVGAIFIPIGLPYSVPEMAFAVMADSYFQAMVLTTAAQVVGMAVVYPLTKYTLRDRLNLFLEKQKIYRGIELVLIKDAWRFSFILRLLNVPLILKNYALAMPDCIQFKVYMITGTFGSILASMPQVWIFQEAEEVTELFENNNSTPLQKAVTISMMAISVLIVVYVFYYTRKMLRRINDEVKKLRVVVVVPEENIDAPFSGNNILTPGTANEIETKRTNPATLEMEIQPPSVSHQNEVKQQSMDIELPAITVQALDTAFRFRFREL